MLVACQACQRHMARHESACPFCGEAARPRGLVRPIAGALFMAASLQGCPQPAYGTVSPPSPSASPVAPSPTYSPTMTTPAYGVPAPSSLPASPQP